MDNNSQEEKILAEGTTRKKTGGRQKGSQNKVTSMTKQVIAELLATYSESGLMSEDFKALEPKDRMTCAEKLMQYIMPKMQSTSVDLTARNADITIEQRLRQLSEDNE